MYHEYPNGSTKHHNGQRLGAARLSPFELMQLQLATADDSDAWMRRAKAAEKAFVSDLSIPDGLCNDFVDHFNTRAHTMTWRQVFYTYRVALWSFRLGAHTLVELVRETGLGA